MKKILFLLLLLSFPLLSFAQNANDTVGLFAVHGKKYEQMDKIMYRKIKGSGGLGAALSMGLAKVKAKMEFSKATSDNVFNGSAHFRFYFGNPPINKIQDLFMFSKNFSIKDFDIARFEKKKNSRLLTGASSSLLGSSVGVASADDLTIKTKEIRSGVYDVEVSGEPGEYCIIFVGNGANGFGGVFDFTIK